jgi:transcription termination/antitermination protein NusA
LRFLIFRDNKIMAMVSEFVAAVNQICSERGIETESVFVAIESALLSAYKKEFGKEEVENLSVELDRETGKFKLIAKKTVVAKVVDADLEMSLKDAQKANKKMKAGDVVELELDDLDFGRIAAQTAKQVIMQKISESEKQAILDEYSGRVGEIFVALMQRMQRGQVVFEIGKATAYMPQDEQIPNEFYKIGEKYKVLLKGIDDTTGGKVLIVSRADPSFLIGLFSMEVPELDSGAIEVKACAREAGSRSKMAIVSHQDGIDPIGACVGQRGMRIANVMNELGEEKIDIIEWNSEPEDFIANALSPAKVDSVVIRGDTAIVKVAEDQLSLAIGREGQNVRLAYKLTGYKIDIEGSNTNKKDV